MAQTTWYANKDTRVAYRESDGLAQGAGASVALPFGYYSGYIYRAYVAFADNIGDLNVIDKAVLWLRTSDQYYVAFGSDPDLNVARLSSWPTGEGSSTGLSTGNATVYGDADWVSPVVSKDVTTAINTWVSVDITQLIKDAKAAGTFVGIMLSSTGTGSGDVGEFWAREKGSSYRPYIVVDYTNNRAPNAPVLTSPASGTKYASTVTAPTFTATWSDPDAGDGCSKYHLQVATDSGFTSLVQNSDNIPSGISGSTITRAYGGSALVPGTTYYWRMATYDTAGLKGPWSSARTFIINALPVISDANLPYAKVKHVAPIHNLADKVTTFTPKPQFTFKPTAVDGEAITGYEVEISGQPVEQVLGSWASGTSIVHKSARTLTNLTSYTVRFRARDAFEGWGPWSNTVAFAVKFMQVIYQWSLPGASGLVATPGTTVGSVQLLYRTATGASGAGAGSWGTSVPSSVSAYLNVMVRTASSGTAPAQPKVTNLTITYYSAALLPYVWTFTGTGWALDESMRKFGTKSLVGRGQGGTQALAQQIVDGLEPNSDYVASVWLLAEDVTNVGFHLLMTQMDFVGLGSGTYKQETFGEWVRVVYPFQTRDESSIRFILRVDPGEAVTSTFHLDGAMLSAGKVAPVWGPAMIAAPGALDALGVSIDATAGGKFRLLGSSGGSLDIVELAAKGLMFGTGMQVYATTVDAVRFDGTVPGGSAMIDTLSGPTAAGLYSAFLARMSGDVSARLVAGRAGDFDRTGVFIGPGNAARDVAFYRLAAGIAQIDDDLRITGNLSVQGYQSPAALTADVNDYSPGSGLHLRVAPSTGVNRTITGLVGPPHVQGTLVVISNVYSAAGGTITLAHDSASSTAVNRFLCPNNVNYVIPIRGSVMAIYDSLSSRWRLISPVA